MVNIAEGYPLRNNQWLYFKHACTGPTLEKVMWAEREGYDGVFVSCQLDIGLYEARTLVDIPVTGTLESAALFAYTMGKHFTLLSVDKQNGEIQRDLLRLYGLERNLVSIIPIHIDANDLYPERTSEDAVFERVVKATELARDRDGAELVIPGCTLFGSLLSHRRRHDRGIQARRDARGTQPHGSDPGRLARRLFHAPAEDGLPDPAQVRWETRLSLRPGRAALTQYAT
jgi:hypothetical protein